jgi:hypothetical protein
VSRRDLFVVARLLVPATIAVALVAGVLPGRLELAIRIYALVVCAVGIGLALKVLGKAYPPAAPLFVVSRPPRGRRPVPEGLVVIERETAGGVASAFDLHQQLRSRLRVLAEGLLSTRRRMSLDADPEASRAALGEATWAIVRPDRPPPADRLASGVPIQELQVVVQSLEKT